VQNSRPPSQHPSRFQPQRPPAGNRPQAGNRPPLNRPTVKTGNPSKSAKSDKPANRPAPAPKIDTPASARLVYGIHAVAELLKNPDSEVYTLFVARESADESGPLAALAERATKRGLDVVRRGRAELDSLTRSGVHQGAVAMCGAYRYADSVAALLSRAERAGVPPLLLVLDGVTDPQNLGALVRTAHVLGGHGVILPKDRAAPVTPTVVKAAAGATEHLPIALVPNLARSLQELKERDVWLVAAVAPGQGGQPPWQLDWTLPLALVLGSEGRGLRPLSRKMCELRVEIPMLGGLSGASLNVAAAGAVLLYEALRQRKLAGASVAPGDGASADLDSDDLDSDDDFDSAEFEGEGEGDVEDADADDFESAEA
jgi:23S rRNA (guanosine2251-2'-O)-methyltransferase